MGGFQQTRATTRRAVWFERENGSGRRTLVVASCTEREAARDAELPRTRRHRLVVKSTYVPVRRRVRRWVRRRAAAGLSYCPCSSIHDHVLIYDGVTSSMCTLKEQTKFQYTTYCHEPMRWLQSTSVQLDIRVERCIILQSSHTCIVRVVVVSALGKDNSSTGSNEKERWKTFIDIG